ncbi:MAG: hypothetical protein QOE90_3362 [Thermoplasmata archaeon]|jgi:serine protease|nr:hypothetical protein [Thermoplasmata archaeon]
MARSITLSIGIVLLALLGTAAASAGLVGATSAPVKHFMPTQLNAPQPLGSASPAVSNMVYGGGPVQTAPKVYLVFWGWTSGDPSGEAPVLAKFFAGVGGSSWANIQTQYSSIGNPSGQLAGTWWDNSSGFQTIPDLYVGNEALRAEAHFGYNANADYIIATPHLHNDAEFGAQYCAWHSNIADSAGKQVAYTDLPYIPDAQLGTCGQNFVNAGAAGNLDGVTIVGGHEYAEAVTDPIPTTGWADTSGQENGDKCAWNSGPGATAQNIVLSTGTFAVQSLWSNAASACAIHYP